jgi:hypothetical protein
VLLAQTVQITLVPACFVLARSQNADWAAVSEKHLLAILDSPRIQVDEIHVFNAMTRWGAEEVKRRKLENTPENMRCAPSLALDWVLPCAANAVFPLSRVAAVVRDPKPCGAEVCLILVVVFAAPSWPRR